MGRYESAEQVQKHPDFAAFHKGHIVLQDHGDKVFFRNIMIKNL
ncbi:family 16 glycoside hydrolase [Paraflavitalea speifideaquila]